MMGIECICCREPTFGQAQKKVKPLTTDHSEKENRLNTEHTEKEDRLNLGMALAEPMSPINASQKRPFSPAPLHHLLPQSPPLEFLMPTPLGGEAKRQCRASLNISKSSEGSLFKLMSSAVHQFGLVGDGKDYDSKEMRLKQLLERIEGPVIVFASTTQMCRSIEESIEKYHAAHAKPPPDLPFSNSPLSKQQPGVPLSNSPLSAWSKRKARHSDIDSTKMKYSNAAASFPCVTVVVPGSTPYRGNASYRYVINYDVPVSGRKYLEHLTALGNGPICEPLGYVYTFVQEKELGSKKLSPIINLLQRVRKDADKSGDSGMVAEMLSALQQLGAESEEDEEEEEEEDEAVEGAEVKGEDEDKCDCVWCGNHCCISYHGAHNSKNPRSTSANPSVEVVRIPMRALDNLDGTKRMIAPRLEHSCTVICLHCLNDHGPWDSYEDCFALPEGLGAVRVVLVLASNCSWHDYPDHGTLMGGVAWVDILDWDSMSHSDRLLESLVDYEISLLGGQSSRVFLAGISQGGGQSLLRFIRSEKQLGGWIGSVCHVPTVPHLPRQHDIIGKQHTANAGRPVRLLCGGSDSVFPPALVLRDIERLRTVGGYSDVRVDVMPGLNHVDLEGEKEDDPPCELMYLSEHLCEILMAAKTNS